MDIEATMQSFAERQSKIEQTILEVGQTLLDVANAQERTNGILATLAERLVATEEATHIDSSIIWPFCETHLA